MIEEMVQRSGQNSIKINKVCDVMLWTSGSSGLINVLQLSKYFLESSKTLYIESPR